MPISDTTPVVTLLEGNTPLVPAPAIAQRIGRDVQVLIKSDGLNPTGSFKDRGMTMAVSKAKEAGWSEGCCMRQSGQYLSCGSGICSSRWLKRWD